MAGYPDTFGTRMLYDRAAGLLVLFMLVSNDGGSTFKFETRTCNLTEKVWKALPISNSRL